MRLTEILRVSALDLLRLDSPRATIAPLKHHRVLRQLQKIDRLPRQDQQALHRTTEAFLKSARSGA